MAASPFLTLELHPFGKYYKLFLCSCKNLLIAKSISIDLPEVLSEAETHSGKSV